jgi:hypothetical protein
VALAVSPFAAPSLRTAVKSCSTSAYTHTERYVAAFLSEAGADSSWVRRVLDGYSPFGISVG